MDADPQDAADTIAQELLAFYPSARHVARQTFIAGQWHATSASPKYLAELLTAERKVLTAFCTEGDFLSFQVVDVEARKLEVNVARSEHKPLHVDMKQIRKKGKVLRDTKKLRDELAAFERDARNKNWAAEEYEKLKPRLTSAIAFAVEYGRHTTEFSMPTPGLCFPYIQEWLKEDVPGAEATHVPPDSIIVTWTDPEPASE